MTEKNLIAQVEACLPQTQCGECDYAGCKPYAEAIVLNKETIDRCPPGGVDSLTAIAKIMGQDPTPYLEKVKANTRAPMLAKIVETECIGCTKCIQACPVDAIIGSSKTMHTVINDECTGCGLCVEPCPVDCIQMIPVEQLNYQRDKAKHRYQAKNQREEYLKTKNKKVTAQEQAIKQKQDYIAAAVARMKEKRNRQDS